MLSVCITCPVVAFNFSFTMATSVPNMFVRRVRMTRGMEEICMKGITICLLITKQTIKSCIITEKVSHCGDTSSGNYGTL